MAYFVVDYIVDQDNYITDGMFTASGKIIIPELHYWFSKFNDDNSLNMKRYPKPVTLNYTDTSLIGNTVYVESGYIADNYYTSQVSSNSFIELLFNDAWDKPSYSYMYNEVTDRTLWPKNIYRRGMLYPKQTRYFLLSPSGGLLNVFSLRTEDLRLLNLLLQYRVGQGEYVLTGYIDDGYYEIGAGIMQDTTYFNTGYIDVDYVTSGSYLQDNFVFEDLTELGKLIYVYLDAKVNGRIAKYDTDTLISSGTNLLTSLYEAYVLENIFDTINARDKDTILPFASQ